MSPCLKAVLSNIRTHQSVNSMRKLLSRVALSLLAAAVVAPLAFAGPQKLIKTMNPTQTHASLHKSAPEKAEKRTTEAKKLQLPAYKKVQPGLAKFANIANRPKAPARKGRKPLAVPAAASEIFGCCIYSDTWTEAALPGWYSISTAAPCDIKLETSVPELMINGGGVMVDGKYYCTAFESFWGMYLVSNYIFDGETWELLSDFQMYSGPLSSIAYDLAYDPVTENVYGVFYNEDLSGLHFGTLNLTDFTSTVIADVTEGWLGLSADKDGNLYAINYTGDFMKVDKNTGATTLIKSTGIVSQYLTSAAIDDATGTFYYCNNNDWEACLWAIDTTTGDATSVYSFPNGDEFTGLYIPAVSAEDGAPDYATDLKADFVDANLDGKISFKAPTVLFDGSTPAAGATLTYKVKAGSDVLATGTCAFGEAVSVDVTMPAPAVYTFVVTTENEVGVSPNAKITLYVGQDTPTDPTNVVLKYADSKMTLTWDPSEGANEGYLGDVTYNISFNGEVKATGVKECTWSEEITEPEALTTYIYTVSATAGEMSSGETKSNKVILGSVVPPYAELFATEEALEVWTIVDANNDNCTWYYRPDGKEMACSYNSSNSADDWLITPPVKLQGGLYYKVGIDAMAYSASWPERIEICVGTSTDPASMTTRILDPLDLTDAFYQTFYTSFTPEEDGTYYFGIHSISEPDRFYAMVDKFTIAAGVPATAPATPTGLEVVADAAGELNATVNVTAPAKAIDGSDLSSLDKVAILCNGDIIYTFPSPAPGAKLTDTFYVREPGYYTFSAVAFADDEMGEESLPFSTFIGAYTAPFSRSFTTEADAADWSIIDNNFDTISWTWYEGRMRIGYNGYVAMDDYLVSPPLKLEAGKLYPVAADMSAGFAERFEILAGTEPTPEGLNIVIVPATDITNYDPETFSGEFMPETSGKYYFAIHGISDPDMYFLYAYNFSVGAGMSTAAPDAPSINVETALDGSAKATVNVTAPATTIAGNPLRSLSKVELYWGEELVKTFDNPAPGAVLSHDMTFEENGTQSFSAIAYNDEGAGRKCTANAYIGINVPAAPAAAYVVETSEGVVTISWEPATTDVDGNPMNPAFVTYMVIDYNGVVAEGIKGTELADVKVYEPGEQNFIQYGVYAVTEAGESPMYTATPIIACGTPFEMPYTETFANCSLTYPLSFEALVASPSADIVSDDYFTDTKSRTGDNGFLLTNSSQQYGAADIYTCKINVTGEKPWLSYYRFAISEQDANTVAVYVQEGKQYTRVDSVDCCGTPLTWMRSNVDLSAFSGKTIQLHFVTTANAYLNTMIDDISLVNPFDHDLAAVSISAPSSVKCGKNAQIDYMIENNGLVTAENYTVSLYCDGELLATAEQLPALAFGESYNGSFTTSFSALEVDTHIFYVKVNLEGDENAQNDETGRVSCEVIENDYPTVQLSGHFDDVTAQNVLEWTEPEIDTTPVDICETFENEEYPSFAIEDFGPWTLKNFNTSETYGIAGVEFPHTGTPFGWILFDDTNVGSGITGMEDSPRSLAAFPHTDGANDAWLISPELDGKAMTVTFNARSYDSTYGLETMKAYYSTTDMEIENFIEIEIGNYNGEVPTRWDEYTLDLPEGTKYFAIQSTAEDIWILQVDNINYRYVAQDLKVNGYNVYRNNEKINPQLVGTTSFTDANAPEKTNKYVVTVAYKQGESKPSNEVVLGTTAASDAKFGVSVTVEGNTIVVRGADKAVISAADGKIYNSAKKQSVVRTTVPSGVYVVETNEGTHKVIVK